jgi:hypothetical protein
VVGGWRFGWVLHLRELVGGAGSGADGATPTLGGGQMWRFLNGPGYRVDIPALHSANPDIAWTSFADWAQHTFGSGSLATQ